MLTEDEARPAAGGRQLFSATQDDDDVVLDQWLASMSSDQFERVFDCLVSLQDAPLSSLEPTA